MSSFDVDPRVEAALAAQDARRERDRQEGPHMPGCPLSRVPLELASCLCGQGYYRRVEANNQ